MNKVQIELNIENCPFEYVAKSLRMVYLKVDAYYDLSFVVHFFDMRFQYQSCGIDPDIWVETCGPSFPGSLDMWHENFVVMVPK